MVVGGGIGGLAAAVALRRLGWDVEVRERRPASATEGSGLSVWPNALRALDALGLGDAVRAEGTVQVAGGIRTRSGRWLLRTSSETLRARHGDGIVVLPRASLLGILRDALPAGVVTDGVAVTDLPDADLVVGADGIGSTVRSFVEPAARPRSTGTIAWRLVAEVDEPLTEGGETWGDGAYAGIAPLPSGAVYVWVVTSGDVDLAGLLADWHDPFPALLARVDPDAAVRTELSWLPPLRTFVRGRTLLLGDAAHAMTPNLGQGACLALEDAATLGLCLAPDGGGIARYDALRRARTARLTRTSRLAGLVAGAPFPLSRARDALAALAPCAVTLRGLDRVLAWRPPR